MNVICLIINKNAAKSYVNDTAVYHYGTKSTLRKYFDFKLFDDGANKTIHSFEAGDVVMFNGKFTYRKDYNGENPMFVCF
jgi:hypothetical protein